jgi:hypothetical protein
MNADNITRKKLGKGCTQHDLKAFKAAIKRAKDKLPDMTEQEICDVLMGDDGNWIARIPVSVFQRFYC